MTDEGRQGTRRPVDGAALDAALDAALARWAQAPFAAPAGEAAAIARIVAHGDGLASAPSRPALPARRRWWPLVTGVAVAASVALLVLVPRPGPDLPEDGAGAGEASFALLFTPVPEEEMPL